MSPLRKNAKGEFILPGHLTLFFLPKHVPQLFISVVKVDECYRSVFFEIYVLYSLFTDAD